MEEEGKKMAKWGNPLISCKVSVLFSNYHIHTAVIVPFCSEIIRKSVLRIDRSIRRRVADRRKLANDTTVQQSTLALFGDLHVPSAISFSDIIISGPRTITLRIERVSVRENVVK